MTKKPPRQSSSWQFPALQCRRCFRGACVACTRVLRVARDALTSERGHSVARPKRRVATFARLLNARPLLRAARYETRTAARTYSANFLHRDVIRCPSYRRRAVGLYLQDRFRINPEMGQKAVFLSAPPLRAWQALGMIDVIGDSAFTIFTARACSGERCSPRAGPAQKPRTSGMPPAVQRAPAARYSSGRL